MAAQIEAPLEIFLELDGTPLENGYIYIGESGKNAEANPITVYWDDAYSIAAAQPIRTIGGYGSNNGIRANVYVSGYYSIVIKDKNGALVFSGDSIVDPSVAIGAAESESQSWVSEAEAMTSESYATQTEDVFVNEYTSNGDGTFIETPTTEYSSLHWAAKSQATGDYLPLAGGTMTGQIKGITPIAAEDLVRKDYVDLKASSGTSTPSIAIIANITSPQSRGERYIKIGNIIHVSGSISVTITSAASMGEIALSLPIASDFSTNYQLAGTAIGVVGIGATAIADIDGSLTNDNANFEISSSFAGTITLAYQYSYEVI